MRAAHDPIAHLTPPRFVCDIATECPGKAVTAKDGKGHAARIAKEVPMFRDIITQAGIKKL